MDKNSKLLILSSLFIFFLGLGFLWFGLKPASFPQPTPQHLVETTPDSTSLTATSSAAALEGQQARVTKVVDGDTFEVEGGLRIRMLGVDTPETKDPRRPVGCFGKEASAKAKELLDGKIVILQKDVSEEDKYKRLLRYVFLPLDNGELLFVNDYLIREGFAKALTIPPDVKYTEQFLQAQREARAARRGLWGKC